MKATEYPGTHKLRLKVPPVAEEFAEFKVHTSSVHITENDIHLCLL